MQGICVLAALNNQANGKVAFSLKRMGLTLLILALGLLFCIPATCFGQTYDATADFSPNANPNGVWSYGWTLTLGTFTPYDTHRTIGFLGPSGEEWYPASQGDNSPDVVYWVPGSSPQLTLAAGPTGEYSIVRWTAPADGNYSINATFSGFYGQLGEVHVLVNNRHLFDSPAGAPAASYSGQITVSQGDAVDFALGIGADGTNSFDRAILTARISPGCGQVNACGSASANSPNGCVNLSFGPSSLPGNLRNHNPYVLASFTAPNTGTLGDYATSCGFTEFNWQQTITNLPCPSPFAANNLPLTNYCPDGSLTAGPFPGGAPPFFDEPPGGYTEPLIYVLGPHDYPFYYSHDAVLIPGDTCVLDNGASIGCPAPSAFPTVLSLDGKTLSFLDDPADPKLPLGGFIAFSTSLVGVSSQSSPGSVSCGANNPLYCTTLFSWGWKSTFNGTAGFTSQTLSLSPIDPGSGTGGVTITSINGGELPSAVPFSQVATTASGLAYSHVSQTFNGTVTVKNIGTSAISGPLQIVFFGMPPGVTLINATNNLSGTPYITVPAAAGLAPGQSVTVSVRFKNSSNAAISLAPVIYSGSIN